MIYRADTYHVLHAPGAAFSSYWQRKSMFSSTGIHYTIDDNRQNMEGKNIID